MTSSPSSRALARLIAEAEGILADPETCARQPTLKCLAESVIETARRNEERERASTPT